MPYLEIDLGLGFDTPHGNKPSVGKIALLWGYLVGISVMKLPFAVSGHNEVIWFMTIMEEFISTVAYAVILTREGSVDVGLEAN
jgi:hypothetical protein